LTLYNKPVNRFVAGFIGSPPMNFLSTSVTESGGKIWIDEGTFKMAIEGRYAEPLKPYIGKNVSFGIRPEDLVYNMDAAEGSFIPAAAEVIEPLGAETHLYVNTGKHQLIARTAPNIHFSVGDKVKFVPNLDKAVFFDAETEQAINLS